jgi:hypothetical protein
MLGISSLGPEPPISLTMRTLSTLLPYAVLLWMGAGIAPVDAVPACATNAGPFKLYVSSLGLSNPVLLNVVQVDSNKDNVIYGLTVRLIVTKKFSLLNSVLYFLRLVILVSSILIIGI